MQYLGRIFNDKDLVNRAYVDEILANFSDTLAEVPIPETYVYSEPDILQSSDGDSILDNTGDTLLGRMTLASGRSLVDIEVYTKQQVILLLATIDNLNSRVDCLQAQIDKLTQHSLLDSGY